MYLFVVTFIVVALTAFLQKYVKQLRYTWNFPGPKAWPIIGNGLDFVNRSPSEIFNVLKSYHAKHGDFIRMWIGYDLAILVTNPKDSETILSSQKHIDKSYEYKYISNWLGDGLLLSSGKKWHLRRKAITPAFHFKILEEFIEVMDQQSNVFVEKLAKYKPTDAVDIYPLVTLCALDVICESAMGTTINAQSNSNSPYVLAVKEITNIAHIRMFNMFMRSNFIFNWTKNLEKEREALKILHGFTDKVILSRRQELLKKMQETENNNEHNDTPNDDLGIKRKMAFLDVLLQSNIDGKPLTNMDIREEVDTFMFEGHDTTTSGIAFALYNIALNPDVQKKLFTEIREVLGDDKDMPVSHSSLNNLHYLDLVLKESLRLFPPVPFIARQINEDVVLNGRTVPAGTSVTVGVYFMGRDARYFPKPEAFIPERFENVTNAKDTNPYMYVPFSAGPRNCIGQKFAVLEMKSVVSKIIRHFKISIDKKSINKSPTLIAAIILRPEDEIYLNFKPRIYA